MSALAHDFEVNVDGWDEVPEPESSLPEFAKPVAIRDMRRRTASSELSWLSSTYSLVAKKDVHAAIDLVFEHFDELLHEGRMREADEALAAVDVKRLDSNLMVAVLTITRAAKDQLNRRADLLRRVESRLQVMVPERAADLIAGLR